MKATLKHARISSRKLRLVADLIRGKKVEEAGNILKYCPKRGSYFLLKLLNSAVANATSVSPEVNADYLYIKQIEVTPGSIIKRWRASPRGRGVPIKKRTSHAIIKLDQKAEKKVQAKVQPKKEKPKATPPPAPAASSKKEETKS
jgi:large subunit ribosomal protein L22